MFLKNQSWKIFKQDQCEIQETSWLVWGPPHFPPFLNLRFFFSKLWMLDQKISSSKLLLGSSLNQFLFLTLQFLFMSMAALSSKYSSLSLNSQLSEINSCPFLLSTVLSQRLSYPGLSCIHCPSAPPWQGGCWSPPCSWFSTPVPCVLSGQQQHPSKASLPPPPSVSPLIFSILAKVIFPKHSSDQTASQLKNFPWLLIAHGRVDITCRQTFKIMRPSVRFSSTHCHLSLLIHYIYVLLCSATIHYKRHTKKLENRN